MIYSKKQIEQFANETHFIKHYVEKVVRLLDVLDFIFSKSSFKDKLLLKGGTAINLVYTNLSRLSVDIDLDYFGSLDREIAVKEREVLNQELDKYMIEEKYEISPQSRTSFALLSKTYKYINAFGNVDNIKVDINFMDRVHLYPLITTDITYFEKTVKIVTPSKEELFGMKLNALIDRSKPRDLFDTIFLIKNIQTFDINMLRKAVVFYLSLNNTFTLDDYSYKKIEAVSYHDVKTQLLPVLKTGNNFNLEETKSYVIEELKKLLVLNNNEKQYLFEFSNGNYKPELLFIEPIVSNIKNHPMAKWRILNLNK